MGYRLYSYGALNVPSPALFPSAYLLVQMLDSGTLKIQLFPGATATATAFDAGAATYIR